MKQKKKTKLKYASDINKYIPGVITVEMANTRLLSVS